MYRALSGFIDCPRDSSIDRNIDNAWAWVVYIMYYESRSYSHFQWHNFNIFDNCVVHISSKESEINGKKSLKIPKGWSESVYQKNNRQYNGQKKKDKQRSTKHTHKTKERVTRTPLKPGVNPGAPEGNYARQQITWRHAQNVIFRVLYKFVMRSRQLCELTAWQLVAIVTRSDTARFTQRA